MQSLRAENANSDLGYETSFWRTPAGDEVDLVMYRSAASSGSRFTRSAVFRETDLRGLRRFCGDYPEVRGFLLYARTKRYTFGKIDVVPFGEAIVELGSLLAP